MRDALLKIYLYSDRLKLLQTLIKFNKYLKSSNKETGNFC
jgi:hypothetical protein